MDDKIMSAKVIRKSGFSNGYFTIIDKKYTGRNPIKKFLSNRAFKKTCKKIFDTSPSFGQLWSFAEFIKVSEEAYFFDNNSKGRLFSSRSYSYGENGFKIHSEADNVDIVIKLYNDNQKVIIQVERLNGGRMKSELVFTDNHWATTPDDSSVVLLDNLIGIINRHIIMLLEYCYNRRGSDDYEKTIPQKYKNL